MKKIFTMLVILSVFTACKNEDKKLKLIENSIKNSSVEVPKNVDDDFELFLKFFNKDSVFQISRVKFPLISKEQDFENLENDKLLEIFIERKDYLKIDLTYNETFKTRELDKYEQKTILTKNNALIEIRGIDNCISNDINFEKINGKWFLISTADYSP